MPGPQYVFTMYDLHKVVPPSREVLKRINLAFFPGAKIGLDGSGKSTMQLIRAA